MTADGPQLVQPGAALVPAAELAARIAGLQAALAGRELDAALLRQNADLYYFAGTVQQSYLYVPAEGEATLFVRKVAERARLESALGAIVALSSVDDLPSLVAERYGRLPARLGLELDVLPVTQFRRLEGLFPEAACEDVGRAVVRQRAVKSAWEIARIAVAAAVADEVGRLIPGLLEEGLTEVAFAGRVEAEARRLGHEGYIRMRGFNQEMFYGQLLTGVSGCVPSYLDTPLAGTGLSPSVAQGPGFRRIGRGEPVVFDFVPVRDGYMADFTRMYALGPVDPELLRVHDVALRVQEAATAAARPGAPCRAV
ncbi:MAG: M24 family metallopeptidase, partial [Deltaproteobacteria bacterium]